MGLTDEDSDLDLIGRGGIIPDPALCGIGFAGRYSQFELFFMLPKK